MKTVLVAAIVATLGVAAVSLWGIEHARQYTDSSSQIYIHGTPVCVVQRDGGIHARVGACDSLREEAPGGAGGRMRVPGPPRLQLPPGHPPIGPDEGPIADPNRRTLI
jgi:hypothetical protein